MLAAGSSFSPPFEARSQPGENEVQHPTQKDNQCPNDCIDKDNREDTEDEQHYDSGEGETIMSDTRLSHLARMERSGA